MREVSFLARMASEDPNAYLERCLKQIQEASKEDVSFIVDGYTLGTFTPTRSLPNTGAATVADVANVLATLIDDIQRRGPNRDQ